MGLADIPGLQMFEDAFGKKWGKRWFTVVMAILVAGVVGGAIIATFHYGKRGLEFAGLLSPLKAAPAEGQPQPNSPQLQMPKCPAGEVPVAPDGTVVLNDRTAIGKQFLNGQPNAAYNHCGTVQEQYVGPKKEKTTWVLPKVDPHGRPCVKFIYNRVEEHNFVYGPPGFDPFQEPPGTCIAHEVIASPNGYVPKNDGNSIGEQEVK